MENDNTLKFAFVVDEEVFHFFQIPNIPELQGAIAGFRSGPTVVEVTDIYDTVTNGKWKYANGEFFRDMPPQSDHNHDQLIDEDDYEVE